ncbi:MAG: SDR family oxidoreductase [Planctomycetes bacterium]|nr:SDR family oxidoreductase [Planctomycetota bacterium]
MQATGSKLVLLTGATGYVGGRLLSLLEQRGVLVRCLARRPEALRGRVGSATETVAGDVLDPASLTSAMHGVDTAYYFVHSMGADRDFEEQDRIAATNFAQAASTAGVRRGRRDPDDLRVGDALDFWRVELYEPPHRLRLNAEMRLPGRAWLEFEVSGDEQRSTIRQTAIFDPVGLTGLLYWYGIYPLHQFVFAGMLRNVVRAARSQSE